jgi:cell division protein FtsW (lipid II flippase)
MRNSGPAFADRRALIWAGAAVLTGCTLLIVMNAPARMPLMNAAAFLIGLAVLGIIQVSKRFGVAERQADWTLLCLALLLPLTALTGLQMDGVSRWLVVAGITVQPSLIVTPLLALAFAARQSVIRLAAVALGCAGLIMQPDPGGAAMLLLGLAAPLALRANCNTMTLVASVMSVGALIIAAARAVDLPPVPFVEQVLAQAANQGPLPGFLAVLAIAFMFLPARNGRRAAACAFAGIWAAAFAASLIGPYPTPVVGFGGSAVLGYVLSVGLLIATTANKPVATQGQKARDLEKDNTNLRFV